MNKHHSLTAALILGSAAAALATPSGLNNIPTADTTPQGTFVLQSFSTIGSDRDTDLNLGFKTGIDLGPAKIELGFASHLYPDDAGPFTAHAKLAVPFGEGLPSIAVGVANTTFSGSDRDDAGDPFGYVVLSHDFGFLRGHIGCGLQDGDAQPFIGFDKTFRTMTQSAAPAPTGKGPIGKNPGAPSAPVYRDLFTLRTDAIQQADSEWLFSAGVLVPICDFLVFETWGNFPSDDEDASLTLKLNFVFKF